MIKLFCLIRSVLDVSGAIALVFILLMLCTSADYFEIGTMSLIIGSMVGMIFALKGGDHNA